MRIAPALGLAIVAALAAPHPARGQGEETPAGPPEPRDVSALLEPLLERHGIPGMAGAVVDGDRVAALGAAGVREKGRETKATTADLWHLGSCTKAMTATLCAMLVEEKKLRWDAPVGEAFKDLPKIDAAWKTATLEQLCLQTAGAPTDLSGDGLWGRLWGMGGPAEKQRLALAEGVLAKPPLHAPGSKFLYANANYALAGAMAERAAGKPWEDLLRERLFKPLGMDSAGFGGPGTASKVDQPRGHRADGTPVLPGPGDDNPAAIGPGGTVHASIGDWAKFVALHLGGARGKPRLLGAESFRRLHTPPAGDPGSYAMGWRVGERPWAGGRVLTHAGSNTMWYCVAWLAPEKGFAVLVCCNRGGDGAAKACDEAASALIRAHLEETAKVPPDRR
jgi:CubicO group peptidase (beta-lactamase class C family)